MQRAGWIFASIMLVSLVAAAAIRLTLGLI
jgi:hypothetical protein